MTDLSITATNVLSGSNATIVAGIAGEAIAAGKVVYRSSTTKRWLLADSDSATAEAREAIGVALNGAALGQPVDVQTSGNITIGATLTAGTAYYLSNAPGGICPLADVGAGEFVCLVGLAKTTTVLAIDIQFPGVQL